MNYRYGLLAVVLAVSSFAAPTLAGVTDLGGGEDVKTTYSESNHYKDTHVYDGKGANVIETTTPDSDGSAGVTGKLRLSTTKDYKVGTYTTDGGKFTLKGGNDYGIYDGYGNYLADFHWYEFDISFTSMDSFVTALNDIARAQGGHSQTYYLNANSGNAWASNASYNNQSSYCTGDISSAAFGNVEVGRELQSSTSEWNVNNSKTEKDLSHSTLTTSVINAEGTVMVGDPDDLFSAYCANGGVTVSQVRDNYYNRTLHYDETVTNTYKVTGIVVNVAKSVTPIVLDLDGDGKIEASNGQYLAHNTFNDSKIAFFDFYNNGFPVMIEWVGANDGLLCRPNADGSVNGSNLFGVTNGFDNGYEEMASLDANNDGQLTGTELQGLKVWTDINGDATAQANELKSLDELGITSIKVSHNNYTSTFVRNGQTFKSFDWWPTAKELRKVDMASVIK